MIRLETLLERNSRASRTGTLDALVLFLYLSLLEIITSKRAVASILP